MYPLFLLFLSIRLFSPASADLSADGSALLAFRRAVGPKTLPWNASLSPCNWKGVLCSGDRVTSLRLPARRLSGQIPAGTLSNLSSLRTLSLRRNALSGPLPPDLTRCTNLRSLFLNHNLFAGKIPPFISSITSLIHLNLADNNFSGEIPSSLNNLTRLTLLYLDYNDFSGEMPDLDIPTLRFFNVSFNRLNGSVPENLRGMPASSFSGMSMCGGPLSACSGSISGGAIAGIAVGAAAFFLVIIILVALFLFFQRKRRAEEAKSLIQKQSPAKKREAAWPENAVSKKQLVFVGAAARLYDLEALLRASAEVLGKGTCGVAYKAAVEEAAALVVVVKRLKNVKMSEKEFAERIQVISVMEHPNLLPLRAYYYSREEKLLVYDYMPFGSLSSLLHGNRGSNRSALKWETRTKIALDVARAIEYIHSTSPSASHGNIKSSNVLITRSYEARVSDHGLAHIVPSSTGINYAQNLTPEADVFSFGVLLLELVTGKAPARSGGVINLPVWVESLIRKGWTRELFDEELMEYKSTEEEEMLMLLQVGVDCTSKNPEHRPEMSSVVGKIEEIRHLAARKKDKQKEKEGPVF